jgi:hypothetical protein
MTDALWWLVCMREALEPADTENGGTYANKAGYHNIGNNLPDKGEGDSRTDHSIRRPPDRSGPWWKTKTSAHDWTFRSAQRGDYGNIDKYTTRLVAAMKSLDDPRPDAVYAYTLGQMDGDTVVEGWSEYRDEPETSGDKTHNWHRHDSFRRNIIGDFWAMWKALTIDMGWSVADWRKSIGDAAGGGGVEPNKMIPIDGKIPEIRKGQKDPVPGTSTYYITRAQRQLEVTDDGDYGPATAAALKKLMAQDPKRTTNDGSKLGEAEWRRLFGLWG